MQHLYPATAGSSRERDGKRGVEGETVPTSVDDTDDLVPLVTVDGMHTFSTQPAPALLVRGPAEPLVLACVSLLLILPSVPV